MGQRLAGMACRSAPLLDPKPYCMQERDSVHNGGQGAEAWKSPQKSVPGKPGRNRALCSTSYPYSLRIVGVPVCVAEYFDQNKEYKSAKYSLIVLSLCVYLY